MRRLLPLPLLALVLLLASAAPASAATNEVRFCAKPNGFQIAAGNLPPQLPRTKCSYAVATFKTINRRPGSYRDLPGRFGTRVRGVGLSCTSRSSKTYVEARCKGRNRFVLIYKFS